VGEYFTNRLIKHYIHDVNRPGNGKKVCKFQYCGHIGQYFEYCLKHYALIHSNVHNELKREQIIKEINRLFQAIKKGSCDDELFM